MTSARGDSPDPRGEQLWEDLADWKSQMQELINRKDSRILELERELSRLRDGRTAAVQAGSAASKTIPDQPGQQPPDVCYDGCRYRDLQKAVSAARPGDQIRVAPETIGSCAVVRKPLHLIGLKDDRGHRAHLVGAVCMGKAPLVINAANVIIEGFEISGVSVPSRNGACVRFDPNAQDTTLRDIVCRDSQNGLLGGVKGRLLIEGSHFEGNGFDTGRAHGMYVWGDAVVIRHTNVIATRNSGHSLKVGAQKLVVEDSVIAALGARNSRTLDAYAGGEIVLRRNVLQQGPESENNDLFGIALESKRLRPGGHRVLIEDNWLISDGTRGRRLFRGRRLGDWILRGNVMVGINEMGEEPTEASDNHWFSDRATAGLPAWDGTDASLPRPDQPKPKGGRPAPLHALP